MSAAGMQSTLLGGHVGKKAREQRRLAARASAPAPRRRNAPSSRQFVWVAAAAVLVIAGALAVGALSLAGGAAGSNGGPLPSGATTFAENDHQHVTGAVQYDHNPPAGGAHNAVWLNCGVYVSTVNDTNAVHSLEHGAVWITYQPDLPASAVSALQDLVTSNYSGTQRYLVLSPYPGIPAPIVASAWGAQLQVNSASDPRLLQFIKHFQGGAQGGEQGGECTGGTGTPVK